MLLKMITTITIITIQIIFIRKRFGIKHNGMIVMTDGQRLISPTFILNGGDNIHFFGREWFGCGC